MCTFGIFLKAIFDDVRPSIFHRLMPNFFQKILSYLKKMKILMILLNILWNGLVRIKDITFYYIDLLKDLLLAVRLLTLLGVAYVIAHPTTFPSQVIFISFISAILPIILSAVSVASNPLILTGFHNHKKCLNMKGWKLLVTKFVELILFPLIPALLFDVEKREIENLKKLLLNSDHSDKETQAEIEERRQFIKIVKGKILTLKKLELTIEIVPQITIFCLMILLKNSDTNTETGLEAVFDVDQTFGLPVETFLILNIIWSLKTGIFTSLRVKKHSKGFIRSAGTFLLLLKNTFTITTRIMCIVMYFVPFLGCLNLATHWEAEQFKFGYQPGQFPDDKFTFYYEGQAQTVDWRDIYRSNKQKIEITDYTFLKLNVAYGVFWGIMILQLLAVTIFQMVFHRAFTFTDVLQKFLHAVEHVHIFDTSDDWDEGEVCFSSLQYKQKWRRVKIELTVGTLLHWVINLLLLFPILIIGN